MSVAPFAHVLEGTHVRLEPLRLAHLDALVEAANEDRSTYAYTVVPASRDAMVRYVEDLLVRAERAECVAFVQVALEPARVVGATRYHVLRVRDGATLPYAVEIGGTWLAASAQRTRVNTEAKSLLLGHAFESWGVARVDLKTNARNTRARLAIARLGATFEGVLRQWQPSGAPGEQGLLRDSAMYSIIQDQWPAVRERLGSLLASPT